MGTIPGSKQVGALLATRDRDVGDSQDCQIASPLKWDSTSYSTVLGI